MTDTNTPKRKLIEVALPLEAINRASQAEKNRKVGKPQNLHHWWSRKPITAARGLLLAQLIDDPADQRDRFATDDDVRRERERLHRLIARSVEWDEIISPSEELQSALHEVIPNVRVADPFVGGGSIPLAAEQFGLDSVSGDLNPVAVLLSTALVDLPARFSGIQQVSPEISAPQLVESGHAEGLAADVESYGRWMHREASTRLGSFYPESNGHSTLAWIWVRTVACPNPACGIRMPLTSKWWLCKKRGKEAYVHPQVVDANGCRSVSYTVKHGISATKVEPGTVTRTGARCVGCQSAVDLAFIRAEGRAGRMGRQLVAVVSDTGRGRAYHEPAESDYVAFRVPEAPEVPIGDLPAQALSFRVQAYGMTSWSDLFTDRQLLALTTFCDLVADAHQQVLKDALATGMERGQHLADGGNGAEAYADAVAVYLGLAVSRLADWSNALCSWEPTGEVSQHLFTGQSIPMVWDVSEANVLADGSSGSFLACLKSITAPLRASRPSGTHRVRQVDARKFEYTGTVIATDPPYFDNIGYSDLSDFFYVWQRRALRKILPSHFETVLVPKSGELIANPFRYDGMDGAVREFIVGFESVFSKIRSEASPDYPMVVYYASKEQENGVFTGASSKWSSILEAVLSSGWQVIRTWPLRSENTSRAVAQGTNAMSASVALVLRPRSPGAASSDRAGFITALRADLPTALSNLLAAGVAPVDLGQSSIGPGMEVFSRFATVREADGSKMPVRVALTLINQVVDQVLGEQEGDFDPTSRFSISWYRSHGYDEGIFGDADNLARSRNTSVDALHRDGVLSSRAGKVRLIKPSDLASDYDVLADLHTSNWEVLHHLIKKLEGDGITPAGEFLRIALTRPDAAIDADLVKELAHLLFRIAESNGWTKDALSFNSLVTSWPEILDVARADAPAISAQGTLDYDEEDD